MIRRDAVGVVAAADAGQNLQAILIDRRNHVLAKVTMPNNAIVNLLPLACSAGFTELVVFAD